MIFIHKNGQQIGPFDPQALVAKLSQGEFSPHDLAWQEGAADWRPINQILGPQFPSRLVPLPPPPPYSGGAIAPIPAAAARSLTDMFGLDIRAALLTILVDMMVFGGDILSAGVLIPVGIGAGCVLAFIVYKIQSRYFGDDHDTAMIKAAIVGLLTAIPVPLTPLVAIPGGVLGLVKALRKK